MRNYMPVLLNFVVVLVFLHLHVPAHSVPTYGRRRITEPAGANEFKGRIIDITHQYTPNMPSYGTWKGLGPFLNHSTDMRRNDKTTNSNMMMPVHSGTHVDAPSHVYFEYLEQGFDVDTLDLELLNGPVLLVDVPRTMNISDVALQQINIPKGVKRVLFRTLNTDRKLMYQKAFDSSYVGFTESGAQWLVANTDVKLVGVDYLSIAASDSLIPAHRILLKNKDMILVEGLKLDDVLVGSYTLHCLPLRLKGSDGSPTRCILIK